MKKITGKKLEDMLQRAFHVYRNMKRKPKQEQERSRNWLSKESKIESKINVLLSDYNQEWIDRALAEFCLQIVLKTQTPFAVTNISLDSKEVNALFMEVSFTATCD